MDWQKWIFREYIKIKEYSNNRLLPRRRMKKDKLWIKFFEDNVRYSDVINGVV